MTHTIYLSNHNKPLTIEPSQLIQAGGEGMVFDLGQTAVKLYHHPTPQYAAKLHHFIHSGLSAAMPPHVLAPIATVTDKAGQVIGCQMAKLPAGSLSMKQLASPLFWKKSGFSLKTAVSLLRQIHTTLTHLHQHGLIIGDLNDHNLFFCHTSGQPATYWIDLDSAQFDTFPCPVALPAFLDPALYHVQDFSKRPYFTPQTDWYAYAVLLVKTLLQTHPFGGTHHRHKTLQARTQAGISVFHPHVTYPVMARPPHILPDEMLHYLEQVFASGRRKPPPLAMLDKYANNLVTCTDCGELFPGERPFCPYCHYRTHKPPTGQSVKVLLTVDGVILFTTLQPDGRFLVLAREGNSYKCIRLGTGGILDKITLFTGQAGYTMAASGSLIAVNPSGRRDLLVLQAENGQVRQVAHLETGLFRETAVFAATPRALYRLAGTWIMRGTMQHGHYVEEAIATAHHNQTIFWGSPYTDTIAGQHRIFAESRFFLWHQGQHHDIYPFGNGQTATVQETAVGFSPAALQFVMETARQHSQWVITDMQGTIQAAGTEPQPATTLAHKFPIAPHQYPVHGNDLRFLQTSGGILAQLPNQLLYKINNK
ncbi:MAG: hypothetical protein Kow0080_11250 [Candidatus Promineifilaceae bacterium]